MAAIGAKYFGYGAVILLITAVLIVALIKSDFSQGDTAQQILWLTLSVVMLLAVLLGYAVVLRITTADLEATRGPLGLPDGSIGAVIALLVLFLFSLSTIYVYLQTLNSEQHGVVSTGLALADVQRFPVERVIQVTRIAGNPDTYDVEVTTPASTSVEIGRTTLATISTLLVAIVGFYFGQRATERGAAMAKIRDSGTTPTATSDKEGRATPP